MDKSSFDVFCPECNMLIEAKVISTGYGGHQSNALNPIDEADAEYYGEYYSVCLCGRCGQPFLIKESYYGIPGEFETITQKLVLFPTENSLLQEELPDFVKSPYDQALKAYKASLFEPCALMCRKCLEGVCKNFGTQGNNLKNRLENLSGAGHIDLKLLNWAHEIRLIANEAAHDIDTPVTKQDAKDTLDFTEAIIIYVFSLTRRFDSLKARRTKAE